MAHVDARGRGWTQLIAAPVAELGATHPRLPWAWQRQKRERRRRRAMCSVAVPGKGGNRGGRSGRARGQDQPQLCIPHTSWEPPGRAAPLPGSPTSTHRGSLGWAPLPEGPNPAARGCPWSVVGTLDASARYEPLPCSAWRSFPSRSELQRESKTPINRPPPR